MRKYFISISVLFLALVLVGQGCAKQNTNKNKTPSAQNKGSPNEQVEVEDKDQMKENKEQMKDKIKSDKMEKRGQMKDQGSRKSDEIMDKGQQTGQDKMKSDESDQMEQDQQQDDQASAPMKVVDVSGTEYDFSPSKIEVKKGQKVKINFTNKGSVSHNLVIPSLNKGTEVISGGETETFTFTAPKTGTMKLDFECTVPGHAQSGMTGEINIEE